MTLFSISHRFTPSKSSQHWYHIMDRNVNRMKAIVKLVSNMAACIQDLEFCSKKLLKTITNHLQWMDSWNQNPKVYVNKAIAKTNGSQDIKEIHCTLRVLQTMSFVIPRALVLVAKLISQNNTILRKKTTSVLASTDYLWGDTTRNRTKSMPFLFPHGRIFIFR